MRYFFEPIEETQHYPCGVCSQKFSDNHRAIQCDFCNYWIHIECEGIDVATYNNLIESSETEIHCCSTCHEDMLNSETEINIT